MLTLFTLFRYQDGKFKPVYEPDSGDTFCDFYNNAKYKGKVKYADTTFIYSTKLVDNDTTFVAIYEEDVDPDNYSVEDFSNREYMIVISKDDFGFLINCYHADIMNCLVGLSSFINVLSIEELSFQVYCQAEDLKETLKQL